MDAFLFENELPDASDPDAGKAGTHDKHHIFGCAQRETGEFYNQKADGIIGMGSEKFHENSMNPPNIIETEFHEKRIQEPTFAICFGHDGGALNFGDWNSWLHLDADDPKRFTTIHTDSLGTYPWASQYRVPLKSVDVEGDTVDYDYAALNKGRTIGEGAFFDSGTTFIYVASDFHSKLKAKFEHYCLSKHSRCGGQSLGLDCYNYSEKEHRSLREFFDSFPTISFDFYAEKPYRLHPEDYLVQPEADSNYCVAIKVLKNMILGGVFWRNYDIKIDKLKKTVSFARADCSRVGGVRQRPAQEPKVG